MKQSQSVPPEGLCEYELQRLERIKRNRQVLIELGLENAAQLFAPPSKQRRLPRKKQIIRSPRRSRRLQGFQPEIQPTRSRSKSTREEEQRQGQARVSSFSDRAARPADPVYSNWSGSIDTTAVNALLARDPDNSHHVHNIHRLRSMSSKALVTRVRRITNRGKLLSFIQVVEAAGGPQEVLEAAKQALKE